MAKIKVETANIATLASRISLHKLVFLGAEAEFQRAANSIDMKTSVSSGIEQELNILKKKLAKQKEQLEAFEQMARTADDQFVQADKRISKEAKAVNYQLQRLTSPRSTLRLGEGLSTHGTHVYMNTVALSGMLGLVLQGLGTVTDGVRTFVETVTESTEVTEHENAISFFDGKTNSFSYGERPFTVSNTYSSERNGSMYNQMTYSDYDKFMMPNANGIKRNVGCTATAEAYIASMFYEKEISPKEITFDNYSCSWDYTSPNTQNGNIMSNGTDDKGNARYQLDDPQGYMRFSCEKILEGTPTMIRVPGHSVVVVGVADTVNLDNINYSDVLVFDPGQGKTLTLQEYFSYKGKTPSFEYWPIRYLE